MTNFYKRACPFRSGGCRSRRHPNNCGSRGSTFASCGFGSCRRRCTTTVRTNYTCTWTRSVQHSCGSGSSGQGSGAGSRPNGARNGTGYGAASAWSGSSGLGTPASGSVTPTRYRWASRGSGSRIFRSGIASSRTTARRYGSTRTKDYCRSRTFGGSSTRRATLCGSRTCTMTGSCGSYWRTGRLADGCSRFCGAPTRTRRPARIASLGSNGRCGTTGH